MNKYETVGDILENVEKDYGKIVSFLIVKDNYDENRKRERYGIVGDDIPTFVEEVSSLEINSSNESDTKILYPIIIHTKTEEGFPQVTITITNNGLVFDGKEYKFEKTISGFGGENQKQQQSIMVYSSVGGGALVLASLSSFYGKGEKHK